MATRALQYQLGKIIHAALKQVHPGAGPISCVLVLVFHLMDNTSKNEIRSSGSRGLSSTKIIARILNAAKIPKMQSELLIETVVSRSTLSRYLSYLLGSGLLEQINEESRTMLRTTNKGLEYLESRNLLSVKKDVASGNQRGDDYEGAGERPSSANSKQATYHYPNWDNTSTLV